MPTSAAVGSASPDSMVLTVIDGVGAVARTRKMSSSTSMPGTAKPYCDSCSAWKFWSVCSTVSAVTSPAGTGVSTSWNWRS